MIIDNRETPSCKMSRQTVESILGTKLPVHSVVCRCCGQPPWRTSEMVSWTTSVTVQTLPLSRCIMGLGHTYEDGRRGERRLKKVRTYQSDTPCNNISFRWWLRCRRQRRSLWYFGQVRSSAWKKIIFNHSNQNKETIKKRISDAIPRWSSLLTVYRPSSAATPALRYPKSSGLFIQAILSVGLVWCFNKHFWWLNSEFSFKILLPQNGLQGKNRAVA